MTYFSPVRRAAIIHAVVRTGQYSGAFGRQQFALYRAEHCIILLVRAGRVWQQSTAATVFDALMAIEWRRAA